MGVPEMTFSKQAAYRLLVIFIAIVLLYIYVSRDWPVVVDIASIFVFVSLGGLLADLSRSDKKSDKE